MPRRKSSRKRGGQSRRQKRNAVARAQGFRNVYEWEQLPKNSAYQALLRAQVDVGPWTYAELRSLKGPYSRRVANIGAGRMAARLGIDPETGVLDGEFDWVEFREIFGDSPPA